MDVINLASQRHLHPWKGEEHLILEVILKKKKLSVVVTKGK